MWTYTTDSEPIITPKNLLLVAGIIASLLIFYLAPPNMPVLLIFLAIVLFTMALLSEKLVDAGTNFCTKVKITPFILGLIILPFLSSLHEQIITILTNVKDPTMAEPVFAQQLSNKLFELLITFGLIGSLLIVKKGRPIEVDKNERLLTLRNGLVMISGTILLFVLVFFDHRLDAQDGAVLIMFYFVFVMIVYFTHKTGLSDIDEEELPDASQISAVKEIIKLAIALTIIILLGNLLTDKIVYLFHNSAEFMKYSFFYVGILIALPNLVISLISIAKDRLSMVIGMNIGSTIWELSISMAIISFVGPIDHISLNIIYFFIVVSIISTITAVIYIRTYWRLHLWETLTLMTLYAIIIAMMFLYF
jgi:Ca2+/Na+ antiporter